MPKRSVTIKDSAAYGVILTQGYGTFGALQVSTPAMIRYGQMTEDELFVTAAAAPARDSHREPQRIGSARDVEALRSRQSGRRAIPVVEIEPRGLTLMTDATHNKPALHNAAWPGVVGKGGGRRAADRPRHDARPDRRGRGRRRQVRRRRPVPVRPARQHRRDRRRAEAAGRQGPSRRAWSIGSVVAPVWPPTGGGSAMDEGEERQEVPRAGPQGLPDRQTAPRAGRPPLRRRPDRLGGEPGDWAKDPEGNTKKIAETFKQAGDDRRGPRRAARRRGGDLLGRHALVAEDGRPARAGRRARDRRLPGRHGPHAPLHAGRERPRGPHPARGLRLEGPGQRSTRRCRR